MTTNPQAKHSALIVDDNWFNRELCRNALDSIEYSLTEADNGERALQLLQEQTFDLMVLDLQMPIVDGRTVLQKVRADPRHVKMHVIVLTAHSQLANDEVDTDADFVMYKPISVVEFARLAARLKESSKSKQNTG